jgi:hypothetical protein
VQVVLGGSVHKKIRSWRERPRARVTPRVSSILTTPVAAAVEGVDSLLIGSVLNPTNFLRMCPLVRVPLQINS